MNGETDNAIEQIATKIKEGAIIPFIGAGACQRADGNCPPLGSKLRQLIARALQYSSNGDMPLGEVPLSTTAQHYELRNNRDELVSLLKREIGKETYLPSLIHQGLARITKSIPELNLIITTNYDSLMEKALSSSVNKPYDKLVQFPYRPNDKMGYRFIKDHVAVYKLHGSLDEMGRPDEKDSLVITDDDYIEFLANMQQRQIIPHTIMGLLSEAHFLFLGYGLQDWDFMVLYKSVIESKNRSKIKKSYTVQKPFTASPPGEQYKNRYWENTKSYWRAKNIHTLEIDQDEFMQVLLEKI